MSFKEVVSTKRFWPSVVYLMIGFVIIYNLFFFAFSYGFSVEKYTANLQENGIVRYLLSNLLGGFCYGFIFTYLQYRKRLKEQKQKAQQ